MHLGQSTSWSLIRGAADGRDRDREQFVERYAPVARAYFEARWRGSARRDQAEDAMQEVFLECFRGGGVLERADPEQLQSFRAFFYGVVQNVARRFEADAARQRAELAGSSIELDRVNESEASLSEVFDRSWARALLREALQLQRAEAGAKGERALKRLEILRLRFEQGMPIREIAASWGADPALVHREYLAARREFRTALLEVIQAHRAGGQADLEAELQQLRALLS